MDAADIETADDLTQKEPNRHAFWSPALAGQRKAYLKLIVAPTMLVTILIVLGMFSIYWGSLWDTTNGVHNLNCAVVDFDGGVIGSDISHSVLAFNGPKTQLTYYNVPATDFQSIEEVADAIVGEKYWAAIVINPGASAALSYAVSTADATYNGSLAITFYSIQARNENAHRAYIAPEVGAILQNATVQFGLSNARALAGAANIATLLSQAPQVISNPAAYVTNDLRPFDVPVASAATFVGLIYLLVVTFFSTNYQYSARMDTGLGKDLTLRSLILVRLATSVGIYFWLSAFYSLVTLAFQAPFNRYYGSAGFPIYWAMSFLAMTALGLALETVVTLLTIKYVPFFLILWVLVNTSVSIFPLEILPTIYRYGYAAPFYNVSRTTRAIILGTRNQIGLNFGVQFAWIAISLITFPLIQTVIRRREERQQAARRRSTP